MKSDPVITTRWWWVRHAPVVGPQGFISGQLNVDCDTSSEKAQAHLAQVAAALPTHARWLTSTLKRTGQTAQALIAARPDLAPVEVLELGTLMEQDFGHWAGKTWDQVSEDASDAPRLFWDAPATTRAPGGESFADVMARVRVFMDGELSGAGVWVGAGERAGKRDIVVVAHGGTIRAALALALGLSPDQALAFEVANLSLSRLEHTGPDYWQVASVNWTA